MNSSKRAENTTNDEVSLLEAAVYVAGRPLDLRTLASILGTRSKEKAAEVAHALVERYQRYNSPIEVLKLHGQRFVMQLKAELSPRVKRFVHPPMLTVGPLRTLSFVAYHQPVLQTRVVEARGSHSYRHLKTLETLNFVTREAAGRTKVIRTTPFFADYFDLSHDQRTMKRQLKKVFTQG